MLFNSLAFLAFFPVVCLVYFLLPTVRTRNIWLLGASYYFYMSWEPLYALLLLTSTIITYLAAIGMDHMPKHKKPWLVASVVGNLAILFFFKYFNWAADNVEAVMSAAGIAMSVPHLDVLLPVGISFYTFQALGYSIDVYWGDVKPERNFLTYALFVSFFPQLVAGPIERSTGLLPQFYKKHAFDGDKAITGIQLMLWGFFLKLVVANNIAHYVDGVYDNLGGQPGGDIFMASVLFCIQLYGDFAGYSYIAIGASRIMGFKLMDNFLRPYFFSASVQEYWKRNHISLTTWFMDYIYYPMVAAASTNTGGVSAFSSPSSSPDSGMEPIGHMWQVSVFSAFISWFASSRRNGKRSGRNAMDSERRHGGYGATGRLPSCWLPSH
jgi:D-alanyl-lipoteichoic acid acyltransferase DltB (MBOAT superfamily)